MTGATASSDELTVIEPPRRLLLKLDELWSHRELAWFLVLRNIKPRYRQTVLGIGWAVIPPVVLMVVFSFFFNRAVGVPSARGVPYPIFAYSGLLIWQFFANAATRGSGSLLANMGFLTKVYFPRLLIPVTTVLAVLFDLALSFLVLVPLMAWYHDLPTWHVVVVVPLTVLAAAAAVAISLWLTAASVRYRDLGLALPLAIQVWLFATPVIYPTTVFPPGWTTIVAVANPLAPIVGGYRWALIGTTAPAAWTFATSTAIIVVALLSGVVFFNRMEQTFADEI
ncbi:MAG: ABC transporter permease [Solirubrobacteraceae bacterium]